MLETLAKCLKQSEMDLYLDTTIGRFTDLPMYSAQPQSAKESRKKYILDLLVTIDAMLQEVRINAHFIFNSSQVPTF